MSAKRAQHTDRVAHGSLHDAVTTVEGLDGPAVPGVDPDVARPPQDIARTRFRERHLAGDGWDGIGRMRQAHADARPGPLDEPRAVEAPRTHAAPAIGLSDLLLGEGDHLPVASRGRGIAALVDAAEQDRAPCRAAGGASRPEQRED